MDIWCELLTKWVGAALAVSTIFFPAYTVLSDVPWTQATERNSYLEP
jgi:hypothetical protein